MKFNLLKLILIMFPTIVLAAGKNETFRITGKVEASTGDGAIVPEGTEGFLAFDVKSKQGKAILKECKVDDTCEVAGTAMKHGETYFLRTIKAVRNVKKSNQ